MKPENTMQPHSTPSDSAVVQWMDPRVNPPPLGVKIVSIAKGGVVVVGNWDKSHLGWHPLLKLPGWLRDRRSEVYLGSTDGKR